MIRILFIGNSHTYYNDMPLMVKKRAAAEGFDCSVTMLAHPYWYLAQHVDEPDVRFNILFGNYDYVVLQEHAHPFGPEEKYFEAAPVLNEWIREAGSTPVIYSTWSMRDEPEMQEHMNEVHRQVAESIGALEAFVGEKWWDHVKNNPDIDMYDPDGGHASAAGSDFAAQVIWDAIFADLKSKANNGVRMMSPGEGCVKL